MDRHAADARGDRDRRRSDHGAVGRPQGRRRGAARGGRAGHPGRQHRPHEPRHDGRAAQARRGRRRQGHGRNRRRQGHADPRRHHLRALPFDRRQFVRAGHRQASRRLAEPRPQSGRDHRAVAGARRRDRRRSTTRGAPASTTRASTSTARTARRSSRRPTASTASTASPRPATATTSRTGIAMSASRRWAGTASFTDPRTGVSVTNGTDDLISVEAAGAAGLPAVAAGAGRRRPEASTPAAAARGKLVFDGQGSCASCHSGARIHRREHAPASGQRGRQRAGAQRRAELRLAQRDQAIPHGAAEGHLAARAVFPQRHRRDAGGGGRDLQHTQVAGPDGRPEGRPRPVPEVALNLSTTRAGTRHS